jgi:hypothetical protein
MLDLRLEQNTQSDHHNTRWRHTARYIGVFFPSAFGALPPAVGQSVLEMFLT